jgi:hypothetical protein
MAREARGGTRLEELTPGRHDHRRHRGLAGRPPEPFAYLGVQATRWSLAQGDRRSGRRNLWLRALDAAGMGYDS